MAGIVGQSDYYGLPEQSRPEPPSEQHLAELLKKPPMFSGPAKLVEAGERWDNAKGHAKDLAHDVGVAADDIGSAIGEVGSAAAWGVRHPIKTMRGESDVTPESVERENEKFRRQDEYKYHNRKY